MLKDILVIFFVVFMLFFMLFLVASTLPLMFWWTEQVECWLWTEMCK